MAVVQEEKVNEDVDVLKDDIRRVRNDFAVALRSLRARAKNLADDSRYKTRTLVPGQRLKPSVAAETIVSDQPTGTVGEVRQPPRRYYQRMPGWFPASIRALVVSFAIGALAVLVLERRRRKRIVVAASWNKGRRSSRLAAALPGTRAWRRRRASRIRRYRQAARDRLDTLARRAAKARERSLR